MEVNMPSTFFGLNIGTTGLYTYQAALNTTAHNVSNAETLGYSRQVLTQQAGVALKINGRYGMVGTGVDVTSIKQVRNEYYDLKYRKNNTIYGNYSTKDYYMKEVENNFNEINMEGFTTSFNKFFDSLQELSKDPSSLTVRTQVTNYASSLSEYFNSLSNSMKGIQEECNFEVKNQVDRINSLSKQIATITKQINNLETGGGTANDLRDARALLVDELSKIANISVTENVVGNNVGVTSYLVKLNGQTLVDNYDYNTLKTVPRTEKINQNDIDGLYDITWESGQRFDPLHVSLTGSLKALFEVRDGNNLANLKGQANGTAGTNTVTITNPSITNGEKINIPSKGIIVIGNQEFKYKSFEYDNATKQYTFTLENNLASNITDTSARIGEAINYKGIPYYMGQMNEFVRTFAKAFNDIHTTGKDLNDEEGLDFFNGKNSVDGSNFSFKNGDPYYNLTAGNFTITDEISKNPSKLAIAKSIVNGVEDKTILNKLIALKSDGSMFKQGAPASFLQTLVAEIGIDADKAATFSESQKNILYMIHNQRLSESGVDVDEEAMSLVKFQNAYNLSAKVIQIMNEIYNKLINDTGV
jgi:flagellar hook-associated protein 1 FlgK